MSFRLGILKKLKAYSNTSKVMHFGKVCFAPLHVSLGPCGCFYDNINHQFNCLLNKCLDLNMNKTHLIYKFFYFLIFCVACHDYSNNIDYCHKAVSYSQ